MAQNPKTLERVPVPAKRTVKFKIGRLMKEAIELTDSEIAETPIIQTPAKEYVSSKS
jgi:hypothetical protein